MMAQDDGGSATNRVKKLEATKEKREAKYEERMAQWQTKHDEFMAKLQENWRRTRS